MRVVESYTKLRAATTATAFLWAKMKTAYRALLFSAAVKAAFAEMSRAAKNSTHAFYVQPIGYKQVDNLLPELENATLSKAEQHER